MKSRRTAILGGLAAVAGAGLALRRISQGTGAPAKPVDMTPEQAKERGLRTLTFVHYNDLHGHYQPRDYNGVTLSPLSLIRGYFDQVKEENPNALFCNAGDDMEKGSLVELVSNGASTLEIYKHVGLHLRAVGNHDFAYGADCLSRFVRETGDVVLCSNHGVEAKNYHSFEVDGIRLGVFSMVGQPWDERNEQYDGPYFKGVSCRYDYVNVVNEMIRKHRHEVDVLFLLSHLGFSLDQQIAAETQGLDLIIGGHSHTVLEMPVSSPGGTLIVQAGCYGQFVGRLDLMMDPVSRKAAGVRYALTPVSPAAMKPNEQLEAKIREICRQHAPDADAPVATLARALSEPDVAKLACEAALSVFDADAAIVDVDTVWAKLPAGPVSRQHFLDAFSVEIQPAGTHGFSAMMTGTLKRSDWESIRRNAENSPFAVASRTTPRNTATVRVALQRRTALHLRKYFPGIAALQGARFEMEAWEMLTKHFMSISPVVPSKPV